MHLAENLMIGAFRHNSIRWGRRHRAPFVVSSGDPVKGGVHWFGDPLKGPTSMIEHPALGEMGGLLDEGDYTPRPAPERNISCGGPRR